LTLNQAFSRQEVGIRQSKFALFSQIFVSH
jgi:hypothetical protein